MNIPPHYRLIDGAKSIPISALPAEAWTVVSGKGGPVQEASKFYDTGAFMRRCIDLRANGVLNVPWQVCRDDGETIWDLEDEEPPDELHWLMDLPDLLWLTEATLCMYPQAFWSHDRNRLGTKRSVGWYAPQTIEPKWDNTNGLVGYIRKIHHDEIPLGLEDVVYFWLRNPFDEQAPRSAPVEAAIAAAGVIFNVDKFAADFFARGAIKATLLAVAGSPPPKERDRIKSLWGRLFKGIKNAFGELVISADSMEAIPVGEGIESLSNNTLTTEKREDVATAFGVPMGLVMSNETGSRATAEQDDLHFYTKTIIPECKLIRRPINTQLLRPMGYFLKANWQAMDIFQEDEEQRSQSLGHLTNAGMDLDLALEVLGFDLTDEQWQRLRLRQKEEDRDDFDLPPYQNGNMPSRNGTDVTPEQQREAAQFRRWASGRKAPNPDLFVAKYISDGDKRTILAEMERGGEAEMRPFGMLLSSN